MPFDKHVSVSPISNFRAINSIGKIVNIVFDGVHVALCVVWKGQIIVVDYSFAHTAQHNFNRNVQQVK